ncbi:hypothetical protein GW846_03285 [Candidatus Gracilibacteria bacterium]|nr:hypothetical protein [Candidatus Gracilibacteria bacterium]
MSLKQEVTMLLDYGIRVPATYIKSHEYVGLSNLIYHVYLSSNSESVKTFVSEVLGEDDMTQMFEKDFLPKIKHNTTQIGKLEKIDQYKTYFGKDYVGVFSGHDAICIDFQLYKKLKKMITESSLGEDDCMVGIYSFSDMSKALVIFHDDIPMIIVSAVIIHKQASLF